jgi:DnaJ like chaperone protein
VDGTVQHIGKIIGGIIGMAALGAPGALLGVIIGHQFDRGASEQFRPRGGFGSANPEIVRRAFFETTFSVMGHLAKADGRVSEDEIRQARAVMYRMQLSPELTQEAMRLFNQGKGADFPLELTLQQFRSQAGGHHDLFRTFLLIQLQAALANGRIDIAERDLLWKMCQVLGISRVELAQLEAMVRAQTIFGSGGQAGAQRPPSSNSLEQAYKVLGVKPTASDAEVKKAYRRLMSQHHPDKLMARGLPESMRGEAEERTQEIRAAYDSLRRARGMR